MPITHGSLLLDLKCGRGEHRWNEFVELYQPLIAHALRQAGIPFQDQEDVLQSVLLQLVKAIPSFSYQREKGFFRAWLRCVAMNQVRDYRRRIGRAQGVISSNQVVEAASAEEEMPDNFDRELLETALKSVQAEVRQKTWDCFHQRMLQQKPAEQVSRELGLSENAVYINTSRVLSRLREFCELHGEELHYDHSDHPARGVR